MPSTTVLRAVMAIGPVVLLLAIGLVVTLRSGMVAGGSGTPLRRMIENLSHLVVALMLCAVFLVMLQAVVGFNPALMW